MTFLAPLLLLAAAALAVPLLLHLRRQPHTRIEDFPALRYVRDTLRERTRMVRLRRLLLLALRLLVLTLLVLAGARLVLPLTGGDQPPAGVVLIVDNGLSSLSVVGEERALEAVREMALEAVTRLGVDDRIWILATGEPWRPSPPLDRDAAAARIRTLDGTAVAGDLDAVVTRARSLLRTGSAEPRRILVVSLLASEAFPSTAHGATDGDDPPIPLLVGRPEVDLPPNRGVARAQLDGGLAPRAGRPISLSVQITGAPHGGQAFRVMWDEELVSRGITDDQGEAVGELPPRDGGWIVGRVELDPDPLRADDVRHFAAPVLPPPTVGLHGTPGRYLEAAVDLLTERGRIDRGPDGISVEAGRPAPGSPAAPVLLLAPRDPADLGAVNRRLRELGVPWSLEPFPAPPPPVTVDRSDPRLGLPEGLEVRRRYRLVPDAGEVATGISVAVLSDGTPWAVLHGAVGVTAGSA
ncbi:MAG: VWA domain-containing protein, partial [Gemmatimonadales bacterium]